MGDTLCNEDQSEELLKQLLKRLKVKTQSREHNLVFVIGIRKHLRKWTIVAQDDD